MDNPTEEKKKDSGTDAGRVMAVTGAALLTDATLGTLGGKMIDKYAPTLYDKAAAPDTRLGKSISPDTMRRWTGNMAGGVAGMGVGLGVNALLNKYSNPLPDAESLQAEPSGNGGMPWGTIAAALGGATLGSVGAGMARENSWIKKLMTSPEFATEKADALSDINAKLAAGGITPDSPGYAEQVQRILKEAMHSHANTQNGFTNWRIPGGIGGGVAGGGLAALASNIYNDPLQQ
jgi:hypothetical protein